VECRHEPRRLPASLDLRIFSCPDLTPSPAARARERVVPISEVVFGTLTQNRSSLEPSLGFAAIAGSRIETAVSLLLILQMEGGTERHGVPAWRAPRFFGVPYAAH
jgi:hypothetical protein